MTTRAANTVNVDITTASKLIGVNTARLFEALRQAGHITRNAKGDNIASRSMVKLGCMINNLRHIQDKPTMPVYEMPLITIWGMQFLRDFCVDKKIMRATLVKSLGDKPLKLGVEGEIARQKVKEQAAAL